MKRYIAKLIFSLTLLISPTAYSVDGVVIAHVDSFSEFTSEENAKNTVRLLFLKRKLNWPNSKKAKPYSLPYKHETAAAFSSNILNMSADEVEQYWKRFRHIDGTLPPINVRSERLLAKMIQRVPHSFGIISKEYWNEISAKNPNLKVLFEF